MRRETTPDGTTIAFHEIEGEGNLVVGLHGFTGDMDTMLDLVGSARGPRPAMLVDLVGHGSSDAPDSIEPYTMASVVDQTLSLIRDQSPGSVHLVGYSMGGRVALSMVARAPWFFGSVTAISASAGIRDPGERQLRYESDLRLADEIERSGVRGFVENWLRQPLFEPLVRSLDRAGLERTIEQRCGASAIGLANSLRGTGAGAMPPVWDAMPTMRAPLLAIAGELDPKYVDESAHLADAVRDGHRVIVPGAGHALNLENPALVATAISTFLEGCERTDGAGATTGEN